MAYIIYKKRTDDYRGETYTELERKETLPEALEVYGKSLGGMWTEVILAEELKPVVTIEVRLADSGASIKLASD